MTQSISLRGAAGLACTLIAVLILPACGGGGSGGSRGGVTGTAIQSTVLLSAAAVDGYASYNGSVTGFNQFNLIRTGDQDATAPLDGLKRGIVHFDHSALPVGAVIQSVVLRVNAIATAGAPVAELGAVVVSHINIGPTLGFDNYATGVIQFNFATLMSDTTLGWKEVDVTAAYKGDVTAGRSRTQFRLEHWLRDGNADGTDDSVYFEDGDNTGLTGNAPELILTYTLP